MRSMKRPSRARRESATTRLKNGRFVAPPRARRMTTMSIACPEMRKGRDFTLVFGAFARRMTRDRNGDGLAAIPKSHAINFLIHFHYARVGAAGRERCGNMPRPLKEIRHDPAPYCR